MEPATNPVDPDVDPHVPAERREVRPSPRPVLAVISAGGVLGALARYGLQQAFPHRAGQFAWATFAINVSGCLLIGVLMALLNEVWPGRRLVRPFLGVGVLGGFTTFSTYIVDIQQALAAGAARTALAYLAATALAALLAVWTGVTLSMWALRMRPVSREAGGNR
ncbi:fluoride efflux transporter FluC [Amycolatopsis methanolica]|uniref:Fluoride-specific ion channel FluC n=1 Tax=Amycolatopsis methanolica 239 TaxID=1068978 RepID=A0A076MWP8_AMYME|nr:CrcB family protein [Amycolatopsis methanolica]AIJ23165.1 camphor resistance protein CrcB [Amycolatopsis methanolica 239]